jgi:hypothetical protein
MGATSKAATMELENAETLPDGSVIGVATAEQISQWMQTRPMVECGCENPQPFNLCCPARLIYPTYTEARQRWAKRSKRHG